MTAPVWQSPAPIVSLQLAEIAGINFRSAFVSATMATAIYFKRIIRSIPFFINYTQ